MNSGKYVFSQLMALISYKKFQSIVARHKGDYKVREFTCWHQFLHLAFAQLTQRESLRDTMLCLQANHTKRYHLGLGEAVALSTLTRANEKRSAAIFEEIALDLLQQARTLYHGTPADISGIKANIFALDATTIDLCLNTFWWAHFHSTKAGIKLHTQLDLHHGLPHFVLITNAIVHEVHLMDMLQYEAGSFYIVDRGYIDYRRLYRIHTSAAFFVTRAKDNMNYRRVYSYAKDKEAGVRFDQAILLNNYYAAKDYPVKLRLVKYWDKEQEKTLLFLTNNMELPALTIARLYKERWQIELFFKWIKQHLKVKSFFGESENAVKVQLWNALAVYAVVAIARKRFCIAHSLYEMLQVISLSAMEKVPIAELFNYNDLHKSNNQQHNQLKMF